MKKTSPFGSLENSGPVAPVEAVHEANILRTKTAPSREAAEVINNLLWIAQRLLAIRKPNNKWKPEQTERSFKELEKLAKLAVKDGEQYLADTRKAGK